MATYISDHWHGRHALTRALGINTMVFNVTAVFLLSHLTSWVEVNQFLSDNAILVVLIVFWSVVFCWQIVGAFRTATRKIKNYGSVSNYYIALAVILVFGAFAMGSVATQYGEDIDYEQRTFDEYIPKEPKFSFTINQSNYLEFSGDIDHGATAKLNALLELSPQSNLLVLNSDGGLISEARGLANVIKRHGLNTVVAQHCFSACTIVFIAGVERRLLASGSLGFHQYYVDSKSPLPWMKPEEEQAKDLRYFQEKNVAAWFMEKAYSTPHNAIWKPSSELLFSAGVITAPANELLD